MYINRAIQSENTVKFVAPKQDQLYYIHMNCMYFLDSNLIRNCSNTLCPLPRSCVPGRPPLRVPEPAGQAPPRPWCSPASPRSAAARPALSSGVTGGPYSLEPEAELPDQVAVAVLCRHVEDRVPLRARLQYVAPSVLNDA
jgi:hypothetical protein